MMDQNGGSFKLFFEKIYTLEQSADFYVCLHIKWRASNVLSIRSLRERPQVEQLIRYIVEEAPEDAEKQRNFK